jgi:4-amino-4-deoxy-L-arabinose transferase-like glycosyltransferase
LAGGGWLQLEVCPVTRYNNHVVLKKWFIPLALIVFYLVSHLVNLTALPVFADEAIYIRWSQLMIDDYQRYALFPLNDGKTPLQMWIMIPFQFLFDDQLYAGRFVSVLVGLGQMLVNGWLVMLLGGRKKTAWLTMGLTALLPFWYFHHRMALIDGMMTLWLSLSLGGIVRLSHLFESIKKKVLAHPAIWFWIGFAGVMFGLGLLTKITAILFLPVFGLFGLLSSKLTLNQRLKLVVAIGVSSALGVAIFGLLKLNPAFGQLFSRGGDFLYPWREVVFEGKWQRTLPNIPSYISYFAAYFGVPLIFLTMAGLFSPTRRRIHHVLFWSALGFMFPIVLLGKVVYPRYLLPAVLFFTLSAAMVIEECVDRWISQRNILWQKAVLALALVLLLSNAVAMSGSFIAMALTKPNSIPFVAADRSQYLTEWSSGHGITQAVAFIQAEAQRQPTAVATEGFFGTLPDGINLYLHRRDVNNLYVDGIGQPVAAIPDAFRSRAQAYEKVYLVVNSHRMKMVLPPEKLLKQYCRPFHAPCLQVWDVTSLVKK